ncbi:hypothetical protein KKI22_00090 [Patescibacteria group bacterium]|nr:hypothetical protein [Patescibacteria group bacterium]
MQITEYWRSNKQWSKYLGKKAKVLAVSLMEVAASDQTSLLPYSYLLLDLGKNKISLMGAAHQEFKVGDEVEIVLRKIKKEAKEEIIVYGLKAEKIYV